MTGPEHYERAEQLIEVAADVMNYEHGIYSSMGAGERLRRQAATLAGAQVHATLALAAATAITGGDYEEWAQAARGEVTR